MPRDARPTLWDTLPPLPDAGPPTDGGPDAEPPFEAYPMTRDVARRVSRMILYREACVQEITGQKPVNRLVMVEHPWRLHAANVRSPGTERGHVLPPLRCEESVGDCEAFLKCLAWAPRPQCEAGARTPFCLPGNRIVRCGPSGFGTVARCADYGGTCAVPAEGEFDPSLRSQCQYGPCDDLRGDFSKCIGTNALGDCSATVWTARSCEDNFGHNPYFALAMDMRGAPTVCHILTDEMHPAGEAFCHGQAECESEFGFIECADDETLVMCIGGSLDTLHCPTLLEGSRCLPDVSGVGPACGTGDEDCFGDDSENYGCDGDVFKYCFAHHRERISCAEMGLRCEPDPYPHCER